MTDVQLNQSRARKFWRVGLRGAFKCSGEKIHKKIESDLLKTSYLLLIFVVIEGVRTVIFKMINELKIYLDL